MLIEWTAWTPLYPAARNRDEEEGRRVRGRGLKRRATFSDKKEGEEEVQSLTELRATLQSIPTATYCTSHDCCYFLP